jgi:hypothetical protein
MFAPIASPLTVPRFDAGIRPALNLDFRAGGQIDARLQFPRASTGTYIDYLGTVRTAPANEPRFTYDGAGRSLGLLMERTSTNLVLWSARLENWLAGDVTVSANAATAPDGTTTADRVTENTASSAVHFLTSSVVSFTSGATYTLSVFARQAAGTRNLRLGFPPAAFPSDSREAVFDLAQGMVVSVPAGITAQVQALANGWKRVSISRVATATSTAGSSFNLYSGLSSSYTGDGASAIDFWGAQVEASAYPTSYVATAGASATRAGDVLTLPAGSWLTQGQGTFLANYRLLGTRPSLVQTVFSLDDNSTSNRVALFATASTVEQRLIVGAAASGINLAFAAPVAATDYAFLVGYQANDVEWASNFGTGTAATSIPAVTQLRLGSRNNADQLDGTLARIVYYARRLGSGELRKLAAAPP